jgi:7-cyano-7-deazaguanine synthase
MSKQAVVLLSGGLDSATVAAIARRDGFAVCALSFDYGQRHDVEIEAAKRVAAAVGAERHVVVPIDLRAFGGSALTDDIPVPKGRTDEDMSAGIPVTYVPARNTIFLSLALAWAPAISSSASTHGTIRAIPIAGRTTLPHFRGWRTSPPRERSRERCRSRSTAR